MKKQAEARPPQRRQGAEFHAEALQRFAPGAAHGEQKRPAGFGLGIEVVQPVGQPFPGVVLHPFRPSQLPRKRIVRGQTIKEITPRERVADASFFQTTGVPLKVQQRRSVGGGQAVADDDLFADHVWVSFRVTSAISAISASSISGQKGRHSTRSAISSATGQAGLRTYGSLVRLG